MRTLILVSGWDAPGINTFISRYVSLAVASGDEVYGADGGFDGVLAGKMAPLQLSVVRRLDGLGGSILSSTHNDKLGSDDVEERLKTHLTEHKVDNVVLFGDRQVLNRIPAMLHQWQIHHIGIPTSINNDIPGTELSLGFDSACNYAFQAIDSAIATTLVLPPRVTLVETLGGATGLIALNVAYGAGAQAVLVPEYEYTDEWLGQRIRTILDREAHALVIVAEGIKNLSHLTETIPKLTNVPLHHVRLGHAQRGGPVSFLDRQLAYDMARVTYESLSEGTNAGIVAFRKGTVELTPTEHVLEDLIPPNRKLYDFINGLA